jgi:hypothetical protein
MDCVWGEKMNGDKVEFVIILTGVFGVLIVLLVTLVVLWSQTHA